MSSLLVPGILQTSNDIHAIMTAPGSGVPGGEVASRIMTRIGRREAITKHNPAKLLALLGQAALTREIGGREVMIGQLRHLQEMAARPNIDLRIVPDRRGWHPGFDDAFTFIDRVRGEPPAVLMLHEDDDVAVHKQAIDRVMSLSLPANKSVEFIAEQHAGQHAGLEETGR